MADCKPDDMAGSQVLSPREGVAIDIDCNGTRPASRYRSHSGSSDRQLCVESGPKTRFDDGGLDVDVDVDQELFQRQLVIGERKGDEEGEGERSRAGSVDRLVLNSECVSPFAKRNILSMETKRHGTKVAVGVRRQGRVLVVDDVKSNRKMLLCNVKPLFEEHDEAEDGAVAVEKVSRAMEEGRPFDVILMDFIMPVMDGPSATAEIRRMGYRGVIFGVTGNALERDIRLFLEKGADQVFLKPLDVVDFEHTLAKRPSRKSRQ